MAVNRVRRNGSYAPLSAHYYKDDAIDEAGEAAELLYVRGLAFCADVLSDGFISERQLVRFVGVGMFDAAERAQRLVDVGLWDREPAGFRVRSWLAWNRSKAEITESMAKDRARKGSGVAPVASESERPDPDPPRGGGHGADRIPNGIPPESETDPQGSPAGFPPRARTPLHSTTLHDTTGKDSAAADAADPEPPPELDLEAPPSPADPRPGFGEFWTLYPNKVKKQAAVQSWDRHVAKARVPPDLVIDALRRQIVSWQAEPQYPRFVPHPPTWLNGRRWNDEFADRPPLRAVSGGYQPYRNPTDDSVWDESLTSRQETR